MTTSDNLSQLATQVGARIKSLRADAGDAVNLTTVTHQNLVAGVNETNLLAKTTIPTDITTRVAALKSDLINGASAAFDTLKEVSDHITAEMFPLVDTRVRFDAMQNLTVPQQTQSCTNINLGNTARNFVTDFNATAN